MYDFSLAVMEKIKEEIFIDKPKENKKLSSDDDDPEDSLTDEDEGNDENYDSDK